MPDENPQSGTLRVDRRPRRVWHFSVGETLFFGGVSAVAGFLCAQFLVAPDWPTEPQARWAAAGQVGDIVSGATGVIGLFAILVAIQTLNRTNEQNRLSTLPYLRVWVGFPCAEMGPTFNPPHEDESLVTLSPEDVLEKSGMDLISSLHTPEENAHELTVWLENVQTAPLGHALTVELVLNVKWEIKGAGQPPAVRTLTMVVAYVLYGQPVRVTLWKVNPAVDYVGVTAKSIRYVDVTGRERTGATGPVTFLYSASKGVTNGPVILGRP